MTRAERRDLHAEHPRIRPDFAVSGGETWVVCEASAQHVTIAGQHSIERTLAIIKPDAVAGGHSGKIIDRIISEGFAIRAMKLVQLTKREAEGFYAVHGERPFFGELTEFMSSAPCIPLVLERENAVAKWREVIGATNPADAAEGTIRKQFATSMGENAVHGSDSPENGVKEGRYFFSESEIVSNGADVIDV